jgi:hypothetical protein
MRRDEVGEGIADGLAGIEWPQGGFQWSDELVADLPFVRGIRAAALQAGDGLWDETIVLADDDRYGMYARNLSEMAQAAGRPWSLWGSQRSAELMRRERMAQADPEFWLELCAQAAAAHLRPRAQGPEEPLQYLQYYGLLWVTRAGLALHGLLFMVDLALRMGRIVYQGGWLHGRSTAEASMFAPLRIAITSCSDDEHAAVMDWLQEHGQGTAQDRLVSAYLCAHRGDWAAASLADGLEAAPGMLKECALPPEAAQSLLERVPLQMHYLRGLLILQFRLRGTAAFGLLVQALRGTTDRQASEAMADLATSVGIPQQIDLLVELMDRKEVRAQLERVAGRYPAAVLKTVAEHLLARAAPGAHARLIEGWAARLAWKEPAALAQAMAALPQRVRGRFQALLDARHGNEARPEQLPPLLREPPWLAGARAPELPVLDQAPQLPADRLTWSEAERARHAAYQPGPMLAFRMSVTPADLHWRLKISEQGQARLMQGQGLQPGDVPDPRGHYFKTSPAAVLALPDAAALALWNSYPAEFWSTFADDLAPVPAILARHGVAALPGLVRYAQAYPAHGLRIALPVDSPRLVPTALYALHHLKQAAVPATDWLRTHPGSALAVALPLAFARDPAVHGPARTGLRWLAQACAGRAQQVAAAYGPAMERALQALLAADPLLLLPARMPGLPGFFVAPSLHRPRLYEGGTLPVAALEHLGRMLAISKLEAPYAGLAIVRQACTPASLAEFAWDVFEAWTAAGAPSKHAWAFAALGLLGDDETVRRLVPRIREWPRQRATTGLDVLAAIGSDAALMQLDGLAGRAKSMVLRDRAKERLAAVAQARGLGTTELADRLVPDLGLDEQGTLALDFGPRRFFVGFDETLKPFVKDAQGVRLKDLPRPAKNDDAALAQAATTSYRQVKKDARSVASLQVPRLQRCMVERRRWPAADFRQLFLAHPLMRHLAARLVWGVYEDGQLARAFRVAEDWTLADAQDALYELPDAATVGIAHVLEMPTPLQAGFGQMLADYEILQPFRQLGRETFVLAPQELQATEIQRFAGRQVAAGSVLGLMSRGWQRGPQVEGAWVGGICRRLPDGLEAQLPVSPGFDLGSPALQEGQRLQGLLLCQAGAQTGRGTVPFSCLDPISASELLRDVALLAPFKE